MWQSWQPACTPVRFAPCTLSECSFATHCIEWQAPPQNALVPVSLTMIWVPTVAAKPMTTPTTTSARTDQRALGDSSARQVRDHQPPPGCVSATAGDYFVDSTYAIAACSSASEAAILGCPLPSLSFARTAAASGFFAAMSLKDGPIFFVSTA